MIVILDCAQVEALRPPVVEVGREGGVRVLPSMLPRRHPPLLQPVGKVSRRHFKLLHEAGSTYIVDMSVHGTFLNGTKLVRGAQMPMRSGDRVAVVEAGLTLYTFLEERAYLRHPTMPLAITTRYLVGRRVGQGSFSTVRKGWTRHTLAPVALKVIEKVGEAKPEGEEERRNEVRVMSRLEHPCVARLVGEGESRRLVVIVMEYYAGGELGAAARRARAEGGLGEEVLVFWWFQLVQAVAYLHRRGVCHRDIKPANVMVVEADPSRASRSLIKLTDIGVSKVLSLTMEMGTVVGSPSYIAPEVVEAGGPLAEGYTVASDCWSLGVTLYELVEGRRPFQGRDVMTRVLLGVYVPLGEGVSQEARQVVTALLQVCSWVFSVKPFFPGGSEAAGALLLPGQHGVVRGAQGEVRGGPQGDVGVHPGTSTSTSGVHHPCPGLPRAYPSSAAPVAGAKIHQGVSGRRLHGRGGGHRGRQLRGRVGLCEQPGGGVGQGDAQRLLQLFRL